MSTVIENLERAQLRKGIPRFKAGDTVRVHFRVIEGTRQRIQVFEGIVLKRQGAGSRETFTVRKQSFGVGVERTFPLHSPKIDKIEVAAIGDVKRAKLYYLREKVGKKARVRELRQHEGKAGRQAAEAADALAAEQAAEALEAEQVEAAAALAAERAEAAEAEAATEAEAVEAETPAEPVEAEAPAEPEAEARCRARGGSARRARGRSGRARARAGTELTQIPAVRRGKLAGWRAAPARGSSSSTAGSAFASSRAPTRPGAARSPDRSSSRACCSTTRSCASTASARSRT